MLIWFAFTLQVTAVRFGIDHDIPEILPAAYYELCILFQLYDHIGDPASAVDWSVETDDWPGPMSTPLNLSKLDLEDRRRLRLGRGALRASWDRMLQNDLLVHTVEPHLKNSCYTSASCARAFDDEWRSFQQSRNTAIDNPLDWLHEIGRRLESRSDLCVICREDIIDRFLNPNSLWNSLPRIFNLVSLAAIITCHIIS